MATISFWRKLGLVRPSDQTPIIRKIKQEQELGKVYFASQTFAKDCLLWTDVHLRRNVTNVPGFRLKPIRKLLTMARQPNRIRADTRNASCCTEREKITSTFLPIFCFLSKKKMLNKMIKKLTFEPNLKKLPWLGLSASLQSACCRFVKVLQLLFSRETDIFPQLSTWTLFAFKIEVVFDDCNQSSVSDSTKLKLFRQTHLNATKNSCRVPFCGWGIRAR